MDKQTESNLNLVQIFLDRQKRFRDRTALLYYQEGQYQPIRWDQWAESVRITAQGMRSLGIIKGDRIALLSENCPEWTYVDLGCLSLGASLVPIYPTSSYEDIAFILRNAEVKVFFVSTQEHYQRLQKLQDEGLPLEKIVIIEDVQVIDSFCMTLNDLSKAGSDDPKQTPASYEKAVREVSPDDLATIIYTSGTTGPPKGVMLTHRNFVSNYLGASEVIPIDEKDISLSFLPLCHVFERLAGYYFMCFHGATIAYARSMNSVPEDIQQVRPTVAAAVPRFYEKIHARIMERIEASPVWLQKVFAWSVGVGCEVARKRLEKKPVSLLLKMKYSVAKALAFNKLKKRLGGRIRFFISGGAPLSKMLAEFFYAADVLILEGYGLTETSPVIAVNSPEAPKFGTVGKPLSVAEVKIAEDGEILTRGECIMKGYYRNLEATQEAISSEGWFHTGDIGGLDEEGRLYITDRKKDIIVTSGGKNISPQNIENHLLEDSLFSQIVIIGDKRNYLVALIVPNESEIRAFTEKMGLQTSRYGQLLKHPEIHALVQKRLEQKMKGMASHESIKYFALLDKEFTQESGELTPTLKVKRKVVAEKYGIVIEELYRKGESYKPSHS